MNVKKINYDAGLDSFIRRLLETEINENELTLYVELFSKYLGYTNPSYKYNITYLNQYTEEFIRSCQNLKHKNEIYDRIYKILMCEIKMSFDLVIDNSYYAHFEGLENVDKSKAIYTRCDTNKINSNKYEIKLEIENKNEYYVFCRKYDSENINFLVDDITLFLQEKGVLEEDK